MPDTLSRLTRLLSHHSEILQVITRQLSDLAKDYSAVAQWLIESKIKLTKATPPNKPADPTVDAKKILRSTEAAAYLGLQRQTLATYRLRGGGPPYVRLGIGSRSPVGYLVSDLDNWLEARRYNSTSHETVEGDK